MTKNLKSRLHRVVHCQLLTQTEVIEAAGCRVANLLIVVIAIVHANECGRLSFVSEC